MPAQTTPQTTSFPDFKKIVLYTGNVMRNGVAGEDTLRNSLQVSAPSFRYYSNEQLLEVPDLRLGGITPENRGQVEVTAKLFYLHQSDIYPASHIVEEALEHLKKILRVSLIDTFIVSANTETTRAIWPELEAQHSNGSLGKLGLTNFAHEELSGFLRDQDVKVKPKINQVNVGQCCNMPIELIRLAKENNVELLHNGDSGGSEKGNKLL
ncbi:hypothetical protein DFQ28_004657 [Apophysomyces sp. BC1034]|nr:hypothetical protein DFQ28_004657 [Apophysomyces sp. BC1034]